jgi:hypothetical protein
MVGKALSYWLDATRAQGDPSRWSKTDVEIGAMRIFDKFKFNAGKSQRERRHAFEAVWEASESNPEAVAYGFGAAIRARIFTMAYVRACAKGFKSPPPVVITGSKTVNRLLIPPDTPINHRPPVAPPVNVKAPKKKKIVTQTGPPLPDVEWS